jgi:2-polyprenyl-6-methoxyphenol hydroxylase-like FAD-dependent oxidoreductase
MTDPVLIVGAGPTGLTAALELSRMGVTVRLIDKREAPAATSRAIGVQARTLELFEQRGLAEEMVRLGNKGRFASIYGGGKRVFRLDFGHVESRYPFMLLISQAETERILREAVARQGVMPQWNTELAGIGQDALSQDASPVQAILKLADGSLERVAAPWLISAEGAHSLVRTTLDLPFEGHTREEQYVLGDLLVAGDLAKETEGAPQFARMTADPFLDPQTREAIDAVTRPVLVIAGVATEAVVFHAALSALESDYRVQVPVDACGGMSARTEDAALRQIEAAGGVTTSVVSLVTAMAPDFAREPGRNTFAALQALRLA